MSETRSVSRSAWSLVAATGSLVVVGTAAFGPWAESHGVGVDGSDDEFVGLVTVVAALALAVFALTRNRRLAAVPLLAGLVSAMVIGHDIADPAGPFGGPGPNIELEWGIWAALAGSLALALASITLLLRISAELLVQAAWRTWEALPEESRQIVSPALARRRRRHSFHTESNGPDPVLPADAVALDTVLGTLWFDGADRHLTPWIRQHGLWEADLMKLMARHLHPGGVVVDVGANVGFHTIHAARLVSPGGIVYTLEPVPDTLQFLEANIGRASCRNVIVLPYAAGDGSGQVRLTMDAGHRSGARLDKKGDITVAAASLDDLVSAQSCDLLKIDTEGAEPLVLRGAKDLLERSPNLLIALEFGDYEHISGEQPRDVLAFYESLGFELCLLRRNGDLTPAKAETVLARSRRVASFNIVLRRKRRAGA